MADNKHPFWDGGSEMAALTRDYDWSQTPLGPIDGWPVSLKVQVQLMLSSRFPMLIFWGPELITFYNDAFRPSLGENGKHPSSLGQVGEVSWAESWPVIGPMIYNIMAGGEAVWFEDQKLPLYRDGKLGYAYWTYSFSPVSDDNGKVNGVLVTCSETTRAVESLQELQKTAASLDSLFAQVSAGIAQSELSGRYVEVNDRFCQMLGYSREELTQKSIQDVTHPEDMPHNAELLKRLIDYGEEFFISKRYLRKDGSVVWANNRLTIAENADGERRIVAVSIENTKQKLQELQIAESESRFQNMIRDASVGLIVLMGAEMRVAVVNDAYSRIIGHSADELMHKPLFDFIPETREFFLPILEKVRTGGEPFVLEGAPYSVHAADGTEISGFINATYQPYREADGSVSGVMVTVHDVTGLKRAQEQLEASEAKLRSIVTTAPAAIGLFVGRDLVIENPNQTFIDIVGKGWGVAGLPLREAMPELLTEGQPFLKILDDVYTTGVPFISPGSLVKIVQNGVLTNRYYNISYSPVFDAEGEVYAVLDVAIDVTEQIEARHKVEEAQQALHEAIELAELATWSIDLNKNHVVYSPRLQEWLGLSERAVSFEESPLVLERDRTRVAAALKAALDPAGSGHFDEVYTVTHVLNGQHKIIHSTGKTVFDETGKPVAINGTSQDVTIQQELRMALENEVQSQTEELAAAVEELQVTNEELAQANTQLIHSNDELAQYAYVASHDLQEPLRKIRVFTDMLKGNKNTLAENKPIIEKISASAERMSLLIQDLLSFSRLLHSDSLMRPVALAETVNAVWEDFELLVAETGAAISIGELPVIEAVGLQMNQLFYNLIGNALKFTTPERAPHIVIKAQRVSMEEVKKRIPKPLPFSDYFHLSISDNGIGFDEQYGEQIFEVFKRLHGRELYPGSGIGLALCRRIAGNHHGSLWAHSVRGEGSTFHLLLPERQHPAGSGMAGIV